MASQNVISKVKSKLCNFCHSRIMWTLKSKVLFQSFPLDIFVIFMQLFLTDGGFSKPIYLPGYSRTAVNSCKTHNMVNDYRYFLETSVYFVGGVRL